MLKAGLAKESLAQAFEPRRWERQDQREQLLTPARAGYLFGLFRVDFAGFDGVGRGVLAGLVAGSTEVRVDIFEQIEASPGNLIVVAIGPLWVTS